MIGRKAVREENQEQENQERGEAAVLSFAHRASLRRTGPRGFTLLELMIVISVIIILAAVALPQYQKAVLHAREATLRDDLFQMRKMIDQYAADKGQLPDSLETLVSTGYMREIPVDPITREKDWTPDTGPDPNLADGKDGLIDVHSSSQDLSSDGTTHYNEW